MGQEKGAQCRYLDNAIWLANTTRSLCDYLLSDDTNKNGDSGVGTTAVVKFRCVAAIQNRVASVTKAAEENKCSGPIFALSPPWTRAFWAGVGLFACYWIVFGFSLGSMAVEEVRRDTFGVDDEFSEMDNRGLHEHCGLKERCLEGRIQLDESCRV